MRTILFCGLPTDEQFARAVRSTHSASPARRARWRPNRCAPSSRAVAVPRGFRRARLHYKCCSTFDSAPHIGSIGIAVEALRGPRARQSGADRRRQPNLGRYCVFGELYAVARGLAPCFGSTGIPR
jgi:uncharacterized protein YgbK (DUF1537 family)